MDATLFEMLVWCSFGCTPLRLRRQCRYFNAQITTWTNVQQPEHVMYAKKMTQTNVQQPERCDRSLQHAFSQFIVPFAVEYSDLNVMTSHRNAFSGRFSSPCAVAYSNLNILTCHYRVLSCAFRGCVLQPERYDKLLQRAFSDVSWASCIS